MTGRILKKNQDSEHKLELKEKKNYQEEEKIRKEAHVMAKR